MKDLIFWYTGATVCAVFALALFLIPLMAACYAAARTYFGVRRHIHSWAICHAIGVKCDPEVVQQIIYAAAKLADGMNSANGLHVRSYSANDVSHLIQALHAYLPNDQ